MNSNFFMLWCFYPKQLNKGRKSTRTETPSASWEGSQRGQPQWESRRWADWVEGGAGVREGGVGEGG